MIPAKQGMQPAAVIDGTPTPLRDYTVHIENDTDSIYNRLGEKKATVKTSAEISGMVSLPVKQCSIIPDSPIPETHTVYLYADVNNLNRRVLLTGVYFTSNLTNNEIEFIAERIQQQ